MNLPSGHRLYIQADAKTAPAVTVDKRGARADIHNAFVLPVGPPELGGTCRMTTTACDSCYAAGSESLSPSLARNAAHNLETLTALYGSGGRSGFGRVVSALVAVVEHSESQQRGRGVPAPIFRWQSGGDLFARWYARAIAEAARRTPAVSHWLYTRDTENVRGLLPMPENLRAYLSGDAYNLARVARASARYGLPVAMLGDDIAHVASLWARFSALGGVAGRAFTCPATGRYTADGRGPAHVVGADGRRASLVVPGSGAGACAACAMCLPEGNALPVSFLLHGGKPGANGGRLGAAVRRRIPLAVAK